jgi:hypothetical protein
LKWVAALSQSWAENLELLLKRYCPQSLKNQRTDFGINTLLESDVGEGNSGKKRTTEGNNQILCLNLWLIPEQPSLG